MLITIKLRSLVEKYGKHTLYIDGNTWYDKTCTNEIAILSTHLIKRV